MDSVQTSPPLIPDYEELPEQRRRVLEGAVEKVVRLAQEVGVTPADIVSLLDSGISIPDLLALIASRNPGVA
jgi:hypothetical protein